MINLQESQSGILELMYGGKPANLRYALQIASLSVLQRLEENGRLARLLTPFVNEPLPERETLTALLRTAKGVLFGSHLNTLYAIDALWLSGKLAKFETIPASYEDQVKWRNELVDMITGMSNKTVSFALLIFAPLQCQLIPYDRHHARRLGNDPNKSLKGKKYVAFELSIMAERNEAGYQDIPLGTYAAMLWAIQKDGVDADSYPSHKALSCRWY
jgi:hypothetical protein